MRPLTEEETKTLFLKLSEYIGKNVEKMINRSDERHCFRLMKDRCYYISESVMKAANNISRDNLLHCGTCIGKFTKSGKFRLHITALEYLSQYAQVCVYCLFYIRTVTLLITCNGSGLFLSDIQKFEIFCQKTNLYCMVYFPPPLSVPPCFFFARCKSN